MFYLVLIDELERGFPEVPLEIIVAIGNQGIVWELHCWRLLWVVAVYSMAHHEVFSITKHDALGIIFFWVTRAYPNLFKAD